MSRPFYLWGAPCREQRQEARILQLRGYTVRTLADEREDFGMPAGPRRSKNLQACAMLGAAAVVLDSHTNHEEQRRAMAFCKELGVRVVLSTDLPAEPPADHLLDEILDSLDRSHRYTTSKPPVRMAVPPATTWRTIGHTLRRALHIGHANHRQPAY